MPKPYREEFQSFGQFLGAVIVAGRKLGTDQRLEYMAAAGLEGGVPSLGGFLVPTEYADRLHDRIYDTGAVISRCTPWPVGRDNFVIPLIDEKSRADGSRLGGVKMTFTLPGAEITASKPKFAVRKIGRRALKGLIFFTAELMQDVPTMAAVFERLFTLEGQHVIEQEIVSGNGTQGPLGILNSDALIVIDKESGQAAATVQAQNFLNMVGRFWAASRRNAVWLTGNQVMAQAESISLSNGRPLVTHDSDGLPRILGNPVLLGEYTSTLGAEGDIILCDLSEYLIGDPEEINVALSRDVKFTSDEVALRIRMRVDGHPAWSSAIQPKNSSTTESPFITLAARA